MSPDRLTASLLLGAFCLTGLAQTAAPPSPPPLSAASQEESEDAEIIVLAGLSNLKEKEAILSYARQTYVKADLIKDKALLQIIRLSLSKLEDQPEKSVQILQEHLNQLSEYFTREGMAAQAAGRMDDALRLAQVAVRCNPGSAKSKLFFANFLHTIAGRTDDAIQTLRHGLEFLPVDDPLTKDYLERYFQLLQARERDQEVIDDGLRLLNNTKNISSSMREVISLSAATSLYWTGKYPDAVNLINTSGLDKNPSGLLLKARALFEGGKTREAVSLLESKSSSFKGAARDAVLSQLTRYHILLGQNRIALAVNQERIETDETAFFPQIQKLHLLDRIGIKEDFDKQLQLVFTRYAANSAAMLALANFAAEKGYSELTGAIAIAADQQGFERVTFAVLHLEALVKGPDPSRAITQYQQIVAADRTYFRAKEPLVMALLGIAHHARAKPDAKTAKIDRDTGNRYLEEFLKAKDLGPEAYRSVGRHLRAIRAGEPAVRILEAGSAKHPRHSQLRADYISARMLAGQTEAYGTRRSVADELELLLTLRRPSPLIWQEASSWLRTESKLPPERLRKLQAACDSLVRSNLDPEALAGF
jgi:tetratricopeptide (TPR) repeat protein